MNEGQTDDRLGGAPRDGDDGKAARDADGGAARDADGRLERRREGPDFPSPRAAANTDEQEEARMMRALTLMSANAPRQRGGGGGRPSSGSDRPGGGASWGGGGSMGGAPGRNGGGRRTVPQASPGQRSRHRFVQDGEVPVVNVARPRRDPLPTLPLPVPEPSRREDDDLLAERAARLDAERRLAETAVQLRSHQTRLGDAELARDAAETELRELRVVVQSLQAENAALANDLARRDNGEAGGRRRSRPEPDRTAEDGPEPVKWWT